MSMGDLALITLSASVSEETKKKEEEEKEAKKKEEEKDEKKQEEEKKEEEPAKEEKTDEAKPEAAAETKEGPKKEKTQEGIRRRHDMPLPRPPISYKRAKTSGNEQVQPQQQRTTTSNNNNNNDNKNNSVPQQIQNIKNKLNELTEAFNFLQNTISPKEEMKQKAAEGTKEGPKEEKEANKWWTVGRNGKPMKH